MRIGLIARADNTGLGTQSWEFFNHIPCKALVIDISEINPMPIMRVRPERYPGQEIFKLRRGMKSIGCIDKEVIDRMLADIDILFCMETPYDYNIFTECRKRGIKSILQLNYELLNYPSDLPKPDLFAAPSMWHWEDIPEPKTYLPVPVNVNRFAIQNRPNNFIHIAGKMAMNDRNGTYLLFDTFRLIKKKIYVKIHSQQPLRHPRQNPLVNVTIDAQSKADYWVNYTGGVLLMPRKYGGLCLPINEALAAGMPVIATDCSPNNNWLPEQWLVQAQYSGTIRCKQEIECFNPILTKLAEKIEEFTDVTFYNEQHKIAVQMREQISWEALKHKYYELFYELRR